MQLDYFGSVDPDESVVLVLDFSPRLEDGELLTGPIAVAVSVLVGSDAAPASILNGPASYGEDQMTVLVPIAQPHDGVHYAIKAVVATTNAKKVLAKTGVLPVEVQ